MIGPFAHDETNGFDAIDRKAPQDSRPRAGSDGISVDLAIRENVAKRKPANFLLCELALNRTPDEQSL